MLWASVQNTNGSASLARPGPRLGMHPEDGSREVLRWVASIYRSTALRGAIQGDRDCHDPAPTMGMGAARSRGTPEATALIRRSLVTTAWQPSWRWPIVLLRDSAVAGGPVSDDRNTPRLRQAAAVRDLLSRGGLGL